MTSDPLTPSLSKGPARVSTEPVEVARAGG